MKEKGIEDAVQAVKKINELIGRTVYQLDIYGQVDPNQTEWFENLKKAFPSYVKYIGIIPYDQSVETLKNYYVLLFPTYYEGEGFAGTLIDAMAAGVPVIASDWKYNGEIIQNGITGWIFPAKNIETLSKILLDISNQQEFIDGMKRHCLQHAYKYSPKNAIKCLFEKL